jgi:PAS domain S-box-containing protein
MAPLFAGTLFANFISGISFIQPPGDPMNNLNVAPSAKSAPLADVSPALFPVYAERSPDVVWLADLRTGALHYINTRFEQWWGVSIGELLNDPEHWPRAVAPMDAQSYGLPSPFFMEDEHTRQSGEIAVREYPITGRDGQSRWIRDSRFFLHDASGQPTMLAGIAKDITQQHALEQAKAVVASSEEMVGRMLHDLRSPLNAISGWTAVLKRGGTSEEAQEKALQAIERNVHQLANLLTELQGKHRQHVGSQAAPLERQSAAGAASASNPVAALTALSAQMGTISSVW